MDFKKLFIGGIIGGIAHFFLGWVVWGMLLMNTLMKHTYPGAVLIFRDEDKMVWWAMIVGNLSMGFLLAYILLKGNVKTAMNGAMTGATVGFLSSVGMNCIMYAQMKVYGKIAMSIDVIATVVVVAIVGAIVGWYFGRESNAA